MTEINDSYHIPLFLFATLRGSFEDPCPHHLSNGLYLERLLDAISMPYLIAVSREKIKRIPECYRYSKAMNRPTVVIFSESVLRGEA